MMMLRVRLSISWMYCWFIWVGQNIATHASVGHASSLRHMGLESNIITPPPYQGHYTCWLRNSNVGKYLIDVSGPQKHLVSQRTREVKEMFVAWNSDLYIHQTQPATQKRISKTSSQKHFDEIVSNRAEIPQVSKENMKILRCAFGKMNFSNLSTSPRSGGDSLEWR